MQGHFIFGVALILPPGLHVPLELVTFKKSVDTTQEARGISQLRLHWQARESTHWWGFWSSKLSCPINRSWTSFLAQTLQCCLLVCKPVHSSWVCLIYFSVQRYITQTGWVLVSTGAFYWFFSFVSGRSVSKYSYPGSASVRVMNYLVHVYSLLCALEAIAFGKKRGFLVCFPSFCVSHFLFSSFLSFSWVCQVFSKLFTCKQVVRSSKNPSPALGPSESPGSPAF